jgi:hypothetical protein
VPPPHAPGVHELLSLEPRLDKFLTRLARSGLVQNLQTTTNELT